MARGEPELGGGVGASDASSGGGIPLVPETDQEVQDAVKTAFFLDPDLPEFVCEIASVNHVVYLRGTVPSLDLMRRAESVAAQVQGVNRVISELQVAQPGPAG